MNLLARSGEGHLVRSAWTNALFIAGVCAGLIGAVASAFVDDRKRARGLYWLSWLISTSCLSLAVLQRGWRVTLAFGLLCVFVAVFYAYMRTPYLKIGGRIYALSLNNIQPDPSAGKTIGPPPSAPPDSYSSHIGQVSAPKIWWILVAFTCIVAGNVYAFGWPTQAIFGTAFLTLLCAGAGIDDATRKLPIARGQYVQAGIATVVSLLLWLAPSIAYLLGYAIGQRWPMGRGKQAAPPDS
ncbi:hypothetical protein [Mycobacterium rhizamassiliense]|uniref:hypothetical protein n=1 Tax=Mycobacterium rhizamassiliense TaxID=1841860 RepID=UPI0012FFB1DD|nr:hypothetical protein [Mycobacterium rhizamassiliense]